MNNFAVISIGLSVLVGLFIVGYREFKKNSLSESDICCEGCGIRNGNVFNETSDVAKVKLGFTTTSQKRMWCQKCKASYSAMSNN